MQLRQLLHHHESEAETSLSVRPIRTLNEEVENVRHGLGRDPDAIVGHFDHDGLTVPPRSDADVAAELGVVGCVAQEIGHDLRQPILVCVDDQANGGHVDIERVPSLLEQRAHHLDGERHDLCDLHRRSFEHHLAARQASDVEQVVDQPNEVLCLPLDHVELLRWWSGGARLEQVHGRNDRRERIAELMARAAREGRPCAC